MKSFPTRVVVILSATASLYAANPPTEFLDIPWSSTPARAEELMLKRPEVKTKEASAKTLVFVGGTFADYPIERIRLEFTDAGFEAGTVYLTIPPGNDKNGVPLRNLQFEKLFKSLSGKYGKIERSGDGTHTEGNWTWRVKDRLHNEERDVAVHLSYSWAPYEFIVRYSNQPAIPAPPPEVKTPEAKTPDAKPPKAKKSKDL